MKNIIILTMVSFLIVFACKKIEDTNDFPVKDPELVANCFFYPDSVFKFQISKSLSIIDNSSLSNLSGATICLLKNGTVIDTITSQAQNEWYYSHNIIPTIGQTYSINVKYDHFNTITAENTIPYPVPITNLTYVIRDSSANADDYFKPSNTDCILDLTFTFNDPKNELNAYMISAYYLDTNYYGYGNDLYRQYLYFDNSLNTNTFFEAYADEGIIFSDNYFNGNKMQITVTVEDWNFYIGKKYFFVLSSLSNAAYLYKKSIALYQKAHNNPFAEPVQIYNNIENGHGIFAGASFAVDSVTIE